MFNTRWRAGARAVAVLNLLLTVIFFLLCAYFVIEMLTRDFSDDSPTRTNYNSTNEVNQSSDNSTSDPLKEFAMQIFWLSSFVVIIIVCLDLLTVILLLKATKTGSDPVVALKNSRIFRNVNILIIICITALCIYFMTLNYILLTEVGLRVLFVGIVWGFIFELNHIEPYVSPKTPQVILSEQ